MIFRDEITKTTLTITASYLLYQLKLKQPRLTYFLSGFASCRIKIPNPTVVWISQITIQNTGKAPARNVRVAHHFMPQHWQVIQAVPYSVEKIEGQDRIIRFDSIEPGVLVTIAYLDTDNARLTNAHDHVRSDDGIVLPTPVQLQRVFSKPINYLLLSLMLLGTYEAISIIYGLAYKFWPLIIATK